MGYSVVHRTAWTVLVVAGVMGGSALTLPPTITHAHGAPTVTLSVYTCCDSLAGFNDTTPTDLSSVHALYASRWAQQFPQLHWQETHFTNQRTMEDQLANAVRARTPPDMVFIQGGDIGAMVMRGLAQPLDQYFTRYHRSAGDFLPGMAHWAHFGGHWWAIPAVSGPLGGQTLYLPHYMTPLGYNNQHLRTFNDYYQMSRKAVRFDATGHLTRIGYWPGVTSWGTVSTLMCPPGHGLYNTAQQPTASDPCNVAYLRYLKKLVDLYGGYATLTHFLAGDPDFLEGNPQAYLIRGKALIVPSGHFYWNLSPLDAHSFGVAGGVRYQLTPLPPTADGGPADVINYPSTLQEVVIPPGARHVDMAFAVSKMMFWDNGAVLGRSLSGSPVVRDQNQWLDEAISGEAVVRRQAGLPGNPAAQLQGLHLQPQLGRLSQASNPINPVDPYYQQQLAVATARVLWGQDAPEDALQAVQWRVVARLRQLETTHGTWILYAAPTPQTAGTTMLYRATAGPDGLGTWPEPPEWRLAPDGTLTNDGSQQDSLILAPYTPGTSSDYEVDAEIKASPGQCPLGFGIVVQWAQNHGLFGSADCHGGPAELWSGPFQGATRLAGHAFTMTTGWLTYRLRIQGAQISYSVRDGNHVLVSVQATDVDVAREHGGQIGLWTHRDRFSVRDVTVRALP